MTNMQRSRSTAGPRVTALSKPGYHTCSKDPHKYEGEHSRGAWSYACINEGHRPADRIV
jgi:hypothetical protein